MQDFNKPGFIILEGHVQGLANLRAAARAGVPVMVVDKNDCIARHSKYCQGFHRCPDFADDAFADFLLRLANEQNLHGWTLMPSNDHAVSTLVRHQERLRPTYRFTSLPPELFEKIYDKSRLIGLAQEMGIPVPATAYFETANPQPCSLQFPIITKGKRGLTFYKKVGAKAIIAHDGDELQRGLQRLGRIVPLCETFSQEVIPFDGTNRTISFTAFCIDGDIQTIWMGAKLREHPLRFGTATFCESVYQEECLEQSRPLLRASRYTGVCEIEYLRDPRDGQFKLIELNARTWLWVGLAIACGVNYPLYVYNFLNGIPSDYPSSYPVGVKWRNYWTDVVFSAQALCTRRLRYAEYLSSLKTDRIVDAVRDEDDPKPFRAMTLSLIKLFIQR